MIRLFSFLAMLTAGPATAQPVCICLECISGPFDRYAPVAGSMKPTIEPGQCAIFRTAFDDISAGTVITHWQGDAIFIRRVIATEGQTVHLQDGQLVIDGNYIPQQPTAPYRQIMAPEGVSLPRCPEQTARGDTCEITRLRETLGGVEYDILDLGPSRLDNTAPVTVPAGHLFVMGDNRDNANDSRLPRSLRGTGFLPLEDVAGILHEVRE